MPQAFKGSAEEILRDEDGTMEMEDSSDSASAFMIPAGINSVGFNSVEEENFISYITEKDN